MEEIDALLGPPGPVGHSAADLRAAMEKLGINVLVVSTTLDNIQARTPPFACIIRIRHRHFVVLRDLDDVNAHLLDGGESRVVSRESLERIWDGVAILCATESLEPDRSSRYPSAMWAIAIAVAIAVCGVSVLKLRRRGAA
jgi:ABC-type bacteriocin/lantibiotic exporter with double-glycine peptidase domain